MAETLYEHAGGGEALHNLEEPVLREGPRGPGARDPVYRTPAHSRRGVEVVGIGADQALPMPAACSLRSRNFLTDITDLAPESGHH